MVHYTCISWFNSLNRNELIKFVQELADIWFYRASLTPETRYTICPEDPLRNYSLFLAFIRLQEDVNTVREQVLNVVESFVFSGMDDSSRSSSVLYMFYKPSLLLIITQERTMPHFYQSVEYSQMF